MYDVNMLKANGVDVEKGIELLGDLDIYNSIMTDFYDGIDDRLKKIEQYKNNKDMSNYAIEVHSLKSDSKYLGFMTLADLSYKHEMASKANDIESVFNHYDELIIEANRIIMIIKKYLKKENDNKVANNNKIKDIKMVTSDEINLSTKAILVADDSSIIRDFIKETFKNKYEVLMASDGKEVINIVNSNSNVLALLLDLNMPNVDGFQVLEYFKEHDLFKKIPVSVITGANDKDSIKKVFSYNIVDMLNKPFNMENVLLVIEKTIGFTKNNY